MSIMKSGQEASSSTSPFTYHVFLSFRGEDTRKGFTDHLYTALVHAGFQTFRDDDGLERGEDIKVELKKAIRESRMSIIVFSKTYASSTWCLDELVMILKRRTHRHAVLPVFYDVDPSEVRKQNGSFEEAFARHEEKLKFETGEQKEEFKNKIGAWRAALRDVANLAGMNLKDLADGHEARFVQKIMKVVGDKVSRTALYIAPHLVGIHSQVKNIQLWLEDGPTNVGIVAICGMGGIGKTTIAKFLYNLNFARFEASSFVENVRERSQQEDGLLRLQRRFLSDILKTRIVKPNSVAEGTSMIKDAVCCKKVFVVLDDVDKLDQLEAILGMRDWLFLGSKIIITTRHERLLKANESPRVHRVENLGDEESLELFSWHAFGKCCPDSGYGEISKRVVSYCGGLPLALKVLGSSLSGQCFNVWESQLDKLSLCPEGEILGKLRISYDSLQDNHDKYLFVHLACFFVGSDKDFTVMILDACKFYTAVGIERLVDKCLISIDTSNKVVMHHLLQEMAREIARTESIKEPGERSIIWNHEDAFDVLRDKTGTRKVEGLKLDVHLLKEDKFASTAFANNRKRSIFSSRLEATAPETSNQEPLEADAFGRMHKLKILHLNLNHVHIKGPYKMLPKGLRWLCWHECPLQSIPSDFPLESLVALELPFSNLKNVWEGTKALNFLKILNLSHSPNLARTPDLSKMPNLERLLLENCASLVEVHESIGQLERLFLLDLENCKNLRKLPRSIGLLKHLKTLVISGCSNLEELPTNIENMDCLTVLQADGIALNQSPSTTEELNAMLSFISSWLLKKKTSPEISWASLPRSLVELNIMGCNLSDDAFPIGFINLCSLKRLYLGCNPITRLPDFVRSLSELELLCIQSCPRLQKLDELRQFEFSHGGGNDLLKEVTFRSFHGPKTKCRLDICDHEGKTIGLFKIEPIRNVAGEIMENLGLSNLQSLGNPNIKLWTRFAHFPQKLPIQGCHETHIFSAYLPCSKVPLWFNFKNLGSEVYFTVPSNLNSRVRGLSVCSVYELSNSRVQCMSGCSVYGLSKEVDGRIKWDVHTSVYNRTKGLIWSNCPWVFGVGEAGEDIMWLSYWKFEKQLLEAGDELKVSMYGGELIQVKEVGVRLLYNEEQQEMSSKLYYEENVSQQIHPFGNIIRGNVSALRRSTKLYQLGTHCLHCKRNHPHRILYRLGNYKCNHLSKHLISRCYCINCKCGMLECWASRLLVLGPYYVSGECVVEELGC